MGWWAVCWGCLGHRPDWGEFGGEQQVQPADG